MGNREALLAGARQCLFDKGYVQTTARDIAQASGVSLAAIGYHFGTKEKLLQEAMVEANAEWEQGVVESARQMQIPSDAPWSDWCEQVWQRLIDASPENQRMMLASLEVLANVDRSTSTSESLSEGMTCAREALVTVFGHDDVSPEAADALGRFYFALEIGIRVLHAVSPGCAPSARQLVVAMQEIAPRICEDQPDTNLEGVISG